MSRVCYSRSAYVRGGPCDLQLMPEFGKASWPAAFSLYYTSAGSSMKLPHHFWKSFCFYMELFPHLASHVFISSNNCYCLCHQIQQAPTPVFWPAYTVPSLSHPLHGVEECCHTTWSPSFWAQAFSGLGATLSLSNVFLLHLYNGKEERGLFSRQLNSSSCNANTCGDAWKDKGSVRKGREKVGAPSITSSFDTYGCTGTGAEGCSA